MNNPASCPIGKKQVSLNWSPELWRLLNALETEGERLEFINAVLAYHFGGIEPHLVGDLAYAFRVAIAVIKEQEELTIAQARELKAKAERIIRQAEKQELIERRESLKKKKERIAKWYNDQSDMVMRLREERVGAITDESVEAGEKAANVAHEKTRGINRQISEISRELKKHDEHEKLDREEARINARRKKKSK